MTNTVVLIAADHRGFELKARFIAWLKEHGYAPKDLGTNSEERCDASDFAQKIAAGIASGEAQTGVLICGTGQAMAMTANRYKKIRAALCTDTTTARLAREHNDANVLALGADIVGPGIALECLEVFLKTKFLGGRYAERRDKLTALGGLLITGMDLTYDIFDTLPRDCWVAVDTAQLTENIRRLQAVAGCPVLAVIKANGYGHGYDRAAKAFLKGGAGYLGVATLSEGMLLRKLGITAPILVICGMLPPEMALAAEAGLDFFVWRADHVKALREIANKHPVRAHIKVDTGMGRGGCWPEEATQIAKELQAIKGVEITGLCTHFASADVPGADDTQKQITKFDAAIASLAAAGIKPCIIHAANSPGALYFPRGRYDMVRLGIVAYGVPPDEGLPVPEGVKTALTWHTKITSTKILAAGHGVGYGSEYKMPAQGRIGVLPVGYADGFRRTPKSVNSVLVDGQERKVLGRICMDQCMIDLNGFDDITGAEVVLIGRQGGKEISAEMLARRWNTNPYDVYTGIAARVPRR